jgi:hypothetical protein
MHPRNREKGRAIAGSQPFFLPLFTNVVEGEFHEVHIPDPGCKGPESSERPDNLPAPALMTIHHVTLMDRYSPRWIDCSIYF